MFLMGDRNFEKTYWVGKSSSGILRSYIDINKKVILRDNLLWHYDGIRAETIKKISDGVALPLSKIKNRNYETGICPKKFKSATGIPVYKKVDRKLQAHYIYNYNTKIFEITLTKRISYFLHNY